jgi:hypothetical protein
MGCGKKKKPKKIAATNAGASTTSRTGSYGVVRKKAASEQAKPRSKIREISFISQAPRLKPLGASVASKLGGLLIENDTYLVED